MIFWLCILAFVATFSLLMAVWPSDKVERTLGIYTFIVALGLFIYTLIKG
jgi:hypothetical protein